MLTLTLSALFTLMFLAAVWGIVDEGVRWADAWGRLS